MLLGGLATLVRRWPGWVLATLGLVTVVLGFFATQRVTSADLDLFATDSPLSARQELVTERFNGGATESRVLVVFDAGRADVLADEPVAAAARLERALRAAPEVQPYLSRGERPVVSFATPIVEALATQGYDAEDAPGFAIDQAAATVLADPALGAAARPLYSNDLDVAEARARGGLLIVTLDPGLDEHARRGASLAVARVVEEVDTPGVAVLPFNRALLQAESAAATTRELPLLFSLGIALIAAILAVNYRTVSDTLIGVVGLGTALLWMQGIAVLLGPGYLGVVGPFTVISNVAPVVLLGLGLDDGIQMTSRYREEQAKGYAPDRAAARALVAVGGAIVLTSLTTEVGFLVNLSSPIPPVGDFGVFTAIGSATSLVVMLTMPAAVRSILDARRPARWRRERARGPGRASAALARVTAATTRAPGAVVVLATLATVAGLLAAVTIPTRFDRRDFLPRGSQVLAAIDVLDGLFGGDLNERTFVLLQGDLATPAAANALLVAEANARALPEVRAEPGAVSSIAGLVTGLAERDAGFAARARPLGLEPGRFAAGADVAGLYELARQAEPERAAELVDGQSRSGVLRVATTSGGTGAEAVGAALEAAAAPLRDAGLTTATTSQYLVAAETNRALADSGRNSILLALLASLALLVGYFWAKLRRPVLGLVTMTAAAFVVASVFGSMWLLDIPYNGLTVTIAAMAVGVGVTFAIHMTYRTMQEFGGGVPIERAVRTAVERTGAALASSGATTAAAFAVLLVSRLVPIEQFGIVSALSIVAAFVAAVLVLPAFLVLWGRRQPAAPVTVIDLRDADRTEELLVR